MIPCLQDVPKPIFMQTKEQKDWNEEEHRLAGEYEKKVKDLQEEREKYRKVHCIYLINY